MRYVELMGGRFHGCFVPAEGRYLAVPYLSATGPIAAMARYEVIGDAGFYVGDGSPGETTTWIPVAYWYSTREEPWAGAD